MSQTKTISKSKQYKDSQLKEIMTLNQTEYLVSTVCLNLQGIIESNKINQKKMAIHFQKLHSNQFPQSRNFAGKKS